MLKINCTDGNGEENQIHRIEESAMKTCRTFMQRVVVTAGPKPTSPSLFRR